LWRPPPAHTRTAEAAGDAIRGGPGGPSGGMTESGTEKTSAPPPFPRAGRLKGPDQRPSRQGVFRGVSLGRAGLCAPQTSVGRYLAFGRYFEGPEPPWAGICGSLPVRKCCGRGPLGKTSTGGARLHAAFPPQNRGRALAHGLSFRAGDLLAGPLPSGPASLPSAQGTIRLGQVGQTMSCSARGKKRPRPWFRGPRSGNDRRKLVIPDASWAK